MFSYQQISRWLSIPVNPIMVEDWLANRELFGPGKVRGEEEEQLETAYQIEEAQTKGLNSEETMKAGIEVLLNGVQINGLLEQGDYVIIAVSGLVKGLAKPVAEIQIVRSGQTAKIQLLGGNCLVETLTSGEEASIFVRCQQGVKVGGTNFVRWSGVGPKKIIFDGRGRPMAILTADKQRELMGKIKEGLKTKE